MTQDEVDAKVESQEPVAWYYPGGSPDQCTTNKAYAEMEPAWIPLYAHPPQRTEQNFCSRCGKRTNDIHTCTPPQENT